MPEGVPVVETAPHVKIVVPVKTAPKTVVNAPFAMIIGQKTTKSPLKK